MNKFCPNPIPWNKVYSNLSRQAKRKSLPLPPTPLILAGWNYSNDSEKEIRWKETVKWASDNGCIDLVDVIPDDEFYFAEEVITSTAGPLGGSMCREWNYEEKTRPTTDLLQENMSILLSTWQNIIGEKLADITGPLSFTGNKKRRLLVRVERGTMPPWGSWTQLSNIEENRRTFTKFRAAINKAIYPLEVDHIDFILDEAPETL
jgi:hypothetical protein